MTTQSNTAKFELMKIAKDLDRESKISLLLNWDSVLNRSSSEDISQNFIKESKLHDPETSDQLIKIIDLLEKFLKADEDISFNNICLFIYPMIIGSKKLTLRPYRIISLVNKLKNLAKTFEKGYRNNRITPELRGIKIEFNNNLKEIKKRLVSLDNEIVTTKRPEQPTPQFSSNKEVENLIKNKINHKASKIASKNLANTIDNMVNRLNYFDIKVAERILDQTTYGYGEEFDKEIKKEILNRLK